MRAALLLIPLLALVASADDEISVIDFCRDYSLVAKKVMYERQQKKPMSDTLLQTIRLIEDWAKKYGVEMDSEKAEEGAATMVLEAYKAPTFPLDSVWREKRQDEIDSFENGVFEECYTQARDALDE